MQHWSYKINYGPDGEENYANVYKGDVLVGNVRTHHAIDIIYAIRKVVELSQSLEWALSNISEEPYDWSDEDDSEAHRIALETLKLAKDM